jgi:hypothetical protein
VVPVLEIGWKLNPQGQAPSRTYSFQQTILESMADNLLDPSTGDFEIRVLECDRSSYQSLYAHQDVLKVHSQYFEASTSQTSFRLMNKKLAPSGIDNQPSGDD